MSFNYSNNHGSSPYYAQTRQSETGRPPDYTEQPKYPSAMMPPRLSNHGITQETRDGHVVLHMNGPIYEPAIAVEEVPLDVRTTARQIAATYLPHLNEEGKAETADMIARTFPTSGQIAKLAVALEALNSQVKSLNDKDLLDIASVLVETNVLTADQLAKLSQTANFRDVTRAFVAGCLSNISGFGLGRAAGLCLGMIPAVGFAIGPVIGGICSAAAMPVTGALIKNVKAGPKYDPDPPKAPSRDQSYAQQFATSMQSQWALSWFLVTGYSLESALAGLKVKPTAYNIRIPTTIGASVLAGGLASASLQLFGPKRAEGRKGGSNPPVWLMPRNDASRIDKDALKQSIQHLQQGSLTASARYASETGLNLLGCGKEPDAWKKAFTPGASAYASKFLGNLIGLAVGSGLGAVNGSLTQEAVNYDTTVTTTFNGHDESFTASSDGGFDYSSSDFYETQVRQTVMPQPSGAPNYLGALGGTTMVAAPFGMGMAATVANAVQDGIDRALGQREQREQAKASRERTNVSGSQHPWEARY